MDDVSRLPVNDDSTEATPPSAVDPDGERIADALRQLLRRWWLVLGGAAIGGAIAVLALSSGTVDPSSRATLALTDAVVWPYQDRARREQVAAATPILEEYADEHGVSASFVLPGDELLIDLDVEAATASEAAAAANELAALVVEQSGAAIGGRLDLEIDRLGAEIAGLDERIAELTDELDELVELEAVARQQTYESDVTAEDRAELERREIDRRPVQVAVDDLVDDRSELAAERDGLIVARDAEAAQVYLVTPATATDPREVNLLTLGGLGALAGAVLAGAIALSWLPRR